jgi:hypothetical protein
MTHLLSDAECESVRQLLGVPRRLVEVEVLDVAVLEKGEKAVSTGSPDPATSAASPQNDKAPTYLEELGQPNPVVGEVVFLAASSDEIPSRVLVQVEDLLDDRHSHHSQPDDEDRLPARGCPFESRGGSDRDHDGGRKRGKGGVSRAFREEVLGVLVLVWWLLCLQSRVEMRNGKRDRGGAAATMKRTKIEAGRSPRVAAVRG